jgi:hypothetical protein
MEALMAGSSFLRNVFQPDCWRGALWQRALLQAALYIGCLVFLYLPALFGLVSDLRMALQRNLMNP